MKYDFDQIIERRNTDSLKWGIYPPEAIPLWVADMDFRSAEPILQAMRSRVEHGIFGYGLICRDLTGILQDRMRRLYGWDVSDREVRHPVWLGQPGKCSWKWVPGHKESSTISFA